MLGDKNPRVNKDMMMMMMMMMMKKQTNLNKNYKKTSENNFAKLNRNMVLYL